MACVHRASYKRNNSNEIVILPHTASHTTPKRDKAIVSIICYNMTKLYAIFYYINYPCGCVYMYIGQSEHLVNNLMTNSQITAPVSGTRSLILAITLNT